MLLLGAVLPSLPFLVIMPSLVSAIPVASFSATVTSIPTRRAMLLRAARYRPCALMPRPRVPPAPGEPPPSVWAAGEALAPASSPRTAAPTDTVRSTPSPTPPTPARICRNVYVYSPSARAGLLPLFQFPLFVMFIIL